MAYFPRKVRSELTPLTNFSGGRVAETSFMFHAAWPASHWPALRPMRGSWLGGDVVMLLDADGAGAVETAVDVELPHAATASKRSEPVSRKVRVVTATVPGWWVEPALAACE